MERKSGAGKKKTKSTRVGVKASSKTGVRKGRSVPDRADADPMERDDMIDWLMTQLQDKMRTSGYKASLGDYIRLMQVKKEMEAETPHDITVTWVAPEK